LEFKALGKFVAKPSRDLDTFPAPENVKIVRMTTHELTSLCPVTGQPDFSTVKIEYVPDKLCIESKSLKLYFWSFREEPAFCEALSAKIAQDVFETIQPFRCHVTITQSVRGGIQIEAEAELNRE